VKLLRVPNVRRVVLDEEAFQRLQASAEKWLRPILLVAFDTGMRKSEVLNLRWSQVDLRAGAVRLEAEDTKTDEPRVVCLTSRPSMSSPDCSTRTGAGLRSARTEEGNERPVVASAAGHDSVTVDEE
jgi:hypothetical protein